MDFNLLTTLDHKLFERIDWPRITEKIAHYGHFKKTKELIQKFPRKNSTQNINNSFNSIEYFIEKMKNDEIQCILSALRSLDENINLYSNENKLTKGHILKLEELHESFGIINLFRQLRKELKKWNKYQSIDLNNFLSTVKRKFLEPFGLLYGNNEKINYQYSSELSDVFEKLTSIERTIRSKIEELLRSPLYSDVVQFNSYDIINSHYVLPIKANEYQTKHGIIIHRSDTNMTFYVEPKDLSILASNRSELQMSIEKIIYKICSEFSDYLNQHIESLKVIANYIQDLDIDLMKSLYSYKNNFSRPKITSDKTIYLKNYFHPLIKDPVKNTLRIDKKSKGAVISGPNTGGKTVTLKSICISQLFIHLGIFLPSEDARMSLFDGIYYLGQDNQDLDKGLSSFSAEALTYIQMLKTLEGNSLIFIDEIFNSTSSEDASSLAIGILEEIHERSNSFSIVSTHHQLLKKIVFENMKDYSSAHVGFNLDTQLPSYILHVDIPGQSMAHKIFANLAKKESFQSSIVEKSTSILERYTDNYEVNLENLEKQSLNLEQEIAKYKSMQSELEAKKLNIVKDFEDEKEQELKSLKDVIQKKKEQARDIIDGVKSNNLKNINKVIDKLNLLNQEEETNEPKHQFITPDEFKINHKYFNHKLHSEVEILKLDLKKKKAFILSGKLKLWCPLDDLSGFGVKKKQNISITITKESSSSLSFDARGMHLEEFSSKIDSLIADLRINAIPFIEVIHGHGEGILKNWLLNYIEKEDDLAALVNEKTLGGSTTIKKI